MIVIGADTHKRTHALAAVDAGTGRSRGQREIKAEEPGHLAAVRWARGLGDERVWAIEDCRHVSRRLEQALIAAGERVVRVPPHRMGASRRGEREPGKSDQIDALAIARAVVKDGVERFPAAYLDEDAMEVRLLADHRRDLVAERTRAQNRLRWHLLELCPELERSLGRGSLEQPRQLDRIDRRLRRMTARARVRVAREQVARIRVLTRQADALQRELLGLIEAQRPQLIAETGCGTLTAAILIGRTAGAERFRTDASFAARPAPHRSPAPPASATATASTAAATASSTTPSTSSPSPAPAMTRTPTPISRAQTSRGQNQEGRTPLPQTPPRPTLPPPPLAPCPKPTRRRGGPHPTTTTQHHDHQRRTDTDALPYLEKIPLRANIS
jgi:transposase